MKREVTFVHLVLAVLSFAFVPVATIASPAQTFTTLASFSGSKFPWNTPLVQGLYGNLYGATSAGGVSSSNCGGTNSCGTVFKITPSGTLTTRYEFWSQTNCTDGISPIAGTTFKLDTDDEETVLHSFNGSDGALLFSRLAHDTAGNLYGTTQLGGAGRGTVFQFVP